ncbi:unnamed protein product [Amaranthus hypochondriacus]
MTPGCLSLTNPNPNFLGLPLNNILSSPSMASVSFSPISLRPETIHRQQRTLLFTNMASLSPKGLGGITSQWRNSKKMNLFTVTFAASHEESSAEGQVDMEENDLKNAGKASQEAWEQTLGSFKEQALKLQSVSQEAYEVYMKNAVITLKETAERLKIQADQAGRDLSVVAKELSEEGREYLTIAAENSPEPVKDVMETFASARDLDDVSKVRDFYIGIPYGTILSAGGFLNFMFTGSISSVRFGMILGGTLLALSISSLRSWRKGQSTDSILKGQAAITSILFLRDARLVFEGSTLAGLFKMIISGAVAAFYIYRIFYDKLQRQPDAKGEATS